MASLRLTPLYHVHRYVGKGMIQIWSMGTLQDSGWPVSEGAVDGEAAVQRPVMAMGILHEGASVWDLKWCPSRASTWDLPEGVPQPATDVMVRDDVPQDQQLPRLGLLAAAFADGSVKIFSVPHPSSLTQDATPVFVRLTPVAEYKLNASNVTSVNWSPHGHHQFLLTGYSDGTTTLLTRASARAWHALTG
jgi:WD40 repeat protein